MTEARMSMTSPIPLGEPFHLADRTVGLERETGTAVFVARTPGRPPSRITGYTIQCSTLNGPPPHAQRHPRPQRSSPCPGPRD